jgi:hypothetical protein
MSSQMPDEGKIRITAEDLDRIKLAPTEEPAPGQSRAYGSIHEPSLPVVEESSGSIFMKAWCYLGLAGLGGSLLSWAVCEHWFVDGGRPTWANHILFPLMLILICVGFGTAESVVEHSPRKAVIRGLLSLGLGTVLGFVFFFIANIIFTIGLSILAQSGGLSIHSPALWITRGIAWMGFGLAGGLVYGIVGKSGKKCLYGVAGGALGAGWVACFSTRLPSPLMAPGPAGPLAWLCWEPPPASPWDWWRARSKTAGFMCRRVRWRASNSFCTSP